MEDRFCPAVSKVENICPYAIKRKEKEPYLSMLSQSTDGGKTTHINNDRMERSVCKVYCSQSGEEKFVGYVWPYYGKDIPEKCPLIQQQKQNQTGLAGFFSKIFRKKSS